MAKYKISLNCAFKEFWRYNLYITGKVFLGGECAEFINHSDIVAQVGAALKTAPMGYARKRTITLTTQEGDALTLYIYIVAHTLPTTSSIAEAPPFKCTVSIADDNEIIFEKQYLIDQWSGNNIEVIL